MSSTRCIRLLCVMLFTVSLAYAACSFADDAHKSRKGWEAAVAKQLPLLGHRNWIVVVDAAYPAQSRAGIDTIYIGGDQTTVVADVLKMVDDAKHVRGIVYLDAELKSVDDKDAPGVEQFRKRMKRLLADRPVRTELHGSIIAKLDEAAKTFRIIILKTDCTIPYTSVFIELDCGYWSAEKERRLRESLGNNNSE